MGLLAYEGEAVVDRSTGSEVRLSEVTVFYAICWLSILRNLFRLSSCIFLMVKWE